MWFMLGKLLFILRFFVKSFLYNFLFLDNAYKEKIQKKLFL